MERWYWVELIGFDNTLEDYAVEKYVSRIKGKIDGISLFLYSSDFVTSYEKWEKDKTLSPEFCSYAAHPNNEERERQVWTYAQLKGLVEKLKSYGIKVLFSTFSTFIYRNEKGEVVVGKFGDKHLDVRENITCKFGNFGSVSMIKRFENGDNFYWFFLDKAKQIIKDFGFDGIHFADGLSFPIKRIQDGDYSDDLVLRFLNNTGKVLPEKLRGKIDGNNELSLERYKFVLENFRAEYTEFISSLYGEFYRKACEVLSGYVVLYMGAWTRDPFESYFRYGIDVKKLCLENAYGYVFENMGASMELFSKQESGGIDFSDEFRQNVQFQFYLTLASLKMYSNNAKIISLTPIKDTFEQWNLIENNPNGLAKGIALRNSNYVYKNGKLEKSNYGATYCLADGLNEKLWDFISTNEEKSDLLNVNKIYGVGYVFNDDIDGELKEYVSSRRLFSHEIRKRLVSAGITFTFATDLTSIEKVDEPLVVTLTENYSANDITVLERRNKPFAVISYGRKLNRKANCEITVENSSIRCDFYNLTNDYVSRIIPNENKVVDLSPYDEYDGIWTAKLKFEEVNKEFFGEIAKIFTAENIPSTDKSHCRVMAYETTDGVRLYVYNNSHHFEQTVVKVPFKIKSAKSIINKCGLQNFTENTVSVKLFNDGVEIIEVVKGE